VPARVLRLPRQPVARPVGGAAPDVPATAFGLLLAGVEDGDFDFGFDAEDELVATVAVERVAVTGALVMGAATVVGAAEVVGATAFTGLVSVSPLMIAEVGNGSTGVPSSTEFMNAFQMCPGRPAP
jgi:hypothetical protein